MRANTFGLAVLVSAVCSSETAFSSPPQVVDEERLGTLTGGPGGPIHPNNLPPNNLTIRYHGQDGGYSYVNPATGRLEFLFGDSWADLSGNMIDGYTADDDGYGFIDESSWNSTVATGNAPIIELGQRPFSYHMRAMDITGSNAVLDLGKTPMTGFASSGGLEFAIFNSTKAVGCTVNNDCGALTCDTGLGFFGVPYTDPANYTGGCADSQFGCDPTTKYLFGVIPLNSGFCRDTNSSAYDALTVSGRVAAIGINQILSLRHPTSRHQFAEIGRWLTNKFANLTSRAVKSFVGVSGANDYAPPDGGSNPNETVFIFGRPGFAGVNATGRPADLYLAKIDMPTGSGTWSIEYWNESTHDFVAGEANADPLDMNPVASGHQSEEFDIVQQMSVVYSPSLDRWIMFYGGGVSNVPDPFLFPQCGLLELFVGPECNQVVIGDGAVHMRMAPDPWGPWSEPATVLVGGDPDDLSPLGEYGSGGILHHPGCSGACAPHSASTNYATDEYGFLYGSNIVSVEPGDPGEAVVTWNVSTWDPYRVYLIRTTVKP